MFKSNLKLVGCADNAMRPDQAYFPTPVAKTADYTLLKTDAGKLLSNKGATGAVNFTLPTVAAGAKIGMRFHFMVVAAQTFTVTASTGIKINGGGTGGNLSAAGTEAEKAFLSIVFTGTNWVITGVGGSWTTT